MTVEIRRATQMPKVTAGLKCPPETWPIAEIMIESTSACAAAIPARPRAPLVHWFVTIDPAPMKIRAKVPTNSPSSARPVCMLIAGPSYQCTLQSGRTGRIVARAHVDVLPLSSPGVIADLHEPLRDRVDEALAGPLGAGSRVEAGPIAAPLEDESRQDHDAVQHQVNGKLRHRTGAQEDRPHEHRQNRIGDQRAPQHRVSEPRA